MQRFDLEKLSRKELQALAKENGVKANLSNADIITKLAELTVDTNIFEEITIPPVTDNTIDVTAEEPMVVEVVPVVDVAPIVDEQNAPVQPVITPSAAVMEDVKVGDSVEVKIDETWVSATVKRVNKKTVRVCFAADAEELTVKFTEIRAAAVEAVETVETASKMEEASTAIVENTTADIAETPTTAEESVVEEIQREETAEAAENTENTEAEDTSAMHVEEPEIATETNNTVMEVSETEETAVLCEVEKIVAPAVEEAVMEVVVEAAQQQAPPTPVAALPQVPPTPVSAMLAPPTPVAAARVSSIGWNFVLQDSAVKVGPANNRRKERRQARRSAMEQLAESMKKENLQAEADAEADMSSEESSAEENVAETVVESGEEIAPAPVVEAITEPAVEPVAQPVVAATAPVVAPTPAAFVASTPAAPAPVAAAHANKGDMLPRMNKAQIMRLGAIQKKIVTTDQVPVESAAFTAKAAVARPSPAMTPNHRSSICTSAPSSVLHQLPGAPFRKAATPLSGRASMLTTGTKRKMSDLGCNSANSTAPDFKNMHKKQFSSLKSIAECVDQDKSVGVRMTIAMESAMTKAKPTPAPVAAAPVAKPAANPFGKVVNKSAANTPSKAAATPAHAQTSRPGSVHTANNNNNLLASKNNGHGNGSSNIVKSRTVTSFVSSAAPSSCGHNNLTSFVNNENSHSTHNASSATSFLKGKDSVGAGKHRTVMLTGGSTIRQQHLTML